MDVEDKVMTNADKDAGGEGGDPNIMTGKTGGVIPSVPGATAGISGVQGASATATQPGNEEKKFTESEVNQIVKNRLEREKVASEQRAEEARKVAEAEAAKKNGEWEKVAKQREDELAKAKADMRERDIKLVATKMGIKDLDYALYLVNKAGDGADAEEVLKQHTELLNDKPAAAGSGNATNPAASNQVFTRSQLRDPVFYQANKAAILQAAREGRIKEE